MGGAIQGSGARQIKLYSSVKPEIVKVIVVEAHAKGLTVTGHVPEGMTAIEAVNYGMDQINHIGFELPYFSREVLGADGKPDGAKAPVLELDRPRERFGFDAEGSQHDPRSDRCTL
jgi:hypothetical protein